MALDAVPGRVGKDLSVRSMRMLPDASVDPLNFSNSGFALKQ